MFNDGIIPDWGFDELRKHFDFPVILTPEMSKLYMDKLDEIIQKYDNKKESVEKKQQPKTTKAEVKKSEETSKNESTKNKDTSKNKVDNKSLKPMDELKDLFDTLVELDKDYQNNKREKANDTISKPSNEVDKKCKVNASDEVDNKSKKEDSIINMIIIELSDGTIAKLKKDEWDEYKIADGCFCISKGDRYTRLYNMQYVVSVIIK